jgi:hypothetical protein
MTMMMKKADRAGPARSVTITLTAATQPCQRFWPVVLHRISPMRFSEHALPSSLPTTFVEFCAASC